MSINDQKKDNIINKISNEADIVWLRWITLFVIIPIYIFSYGRQINYIFLIIFILGIVFNFFNHFILINKLFPEKWFSKNIYFDLAFTTALVVVDGGFNSMFFIGYFVIIIYEGVKNSYSQPVLLGICTSILYIGSSYLVLEDSLNLSQIILRNLFIVISGVFVYQILKEYNYQSKLQKKHYDMYIKDQLTGLYNRNVFEKVLNQEIIECVNKETNISVLLFDIDNFEMFNDTYGRFTGDDLLKYFSKIILETISSKDKAFRYGGEEFIVLLKDVELQEAYKKAENIRKKLSSSKIYVTDDDDKYKITVSCGIACCPEHSNGYYELLEYADKALYEAKCDGKNKVVIAEKEEN